MCDKSNLRLPRKFLAIGDVHGDLQALVRAFELANELGLSPICFGDIVGGEADHACIKAVKDNGCLTIRGNHEQWAWEKSDSSYSESELEWLGEMPLHLSNDDTLALHTKFFQRSDGQIEWHQLQAAVEVSDFLAENTKYKTILCAHTHLPAVNVRQSGSLEFISSSRLKQNPKLTLNGEQWIIDIGWAPRNVVIFDSETSETRVHFIFFN